MSDLTDKPASVGNNTGSAAPSLSGTPSNGGRALSDHLDWSDPTDIEAAAALCDERDLAEIESNLSDGEYTAYFSALADLLGAHAARVDRCRDVLLLTLMPRARQFVHSRRLAYRERCRMDYEADRSQAEMESRL